MPNPARSPFGPGDDGAPTGLSAEMVNKHAADPDRRAKAEEAAALAATASRRTPN